MIEVDVEHPVGRVTLAGSFASEGRLTALFGRSGAGKTSLVNIIAGLTRPRRGRVVVDGAVLVDTAAGVFVPAHRRRVGYVFQEGRLFPHLSVAGNLAYGAWFTPRRERRAAREEIIALLGLERLLAARPHELSGGERQRVAVGRALMASPRLLLMDEPLASLDDERKREILPYIERLRDEVGVPIVLVSHSVGEVARLAATVVLIAEGRILAAGPPAEVLGHVDRTTADVGPTAVVEATVAAIEPDGLARLETAAGPLLMPADGLVAGQRIRIAIDAADVMVADRVPAGLSALNVLPATIAAIDPPKGAAQTVRLDCSGVAVAARITRRSVAALGLAPGKPVQAVIKGVALFRGRG